MRLSQNTPPQEEPLTLEDMKTFLRINSDQEDATLTQLLQSARAYVEDATGRALIKQKWRLEIVPPYPPLSPLVQRRKRRLEITLPRPPLLRIESVQHKEKTVPFDVDGNTMILPATLWDEPLSILYWAGYGETRSAVPPTLHYAVLMVVRALYDQRPVEGTLLNPFRVYRL